MYALARNLLFKLDAERAHELTLELFRRMPMVSTAPFRCIGQPAPVTLMGLEFRNPVGLAAGLDKNGECLRAWEALGFGFVEVGTVTPRPQPGNPRPRMFRLPEHQALINRLGFNNKGVDHLLRQVAQAGYRGVLGINIGKNFDTPIERAADDYLHCLRRVYAAASYVTVNISSPNTRNLRELQDESNLRGLLTAIDGQREALADQHGLRRPILVKIAPDVTDEQIDIIASVTRECGMDGLIATNTTISRAGVETDPLASEGGGLSGRPLRPMAEAVMRRLRSRVGAGFPLIGVGGIVSGADALARQDAGADLLQIYSGFIYRGPGLIRECVQALTASPARSGA